MREKLGLDLGERVRERTVYRAVRRPEDLNLFLIKINIINLRVRVQRGRSEVEKLKKAKRLADTKLNYFTIY